MPVALEDLRGNVCRGNAQALAHIVLDERGNVGEITHGTAHFAGLDPLAGVLEALDVPFHLLMPQGPFQAEGGNVGMDAVRAADTGRVLEFKGAALQDFLEGLEVLEEDLVSLLEEVAVGGVHDVGGGEPVMDPLALGTEAFADGAGEGHHVVAGDFFDFLDTVHIKGGCGADLFNVLLRDDAQFAPGFAGEDFDFEVRLELVLLGPDVPPSGMCRCSFQCGRPGPDPPP